MYLPTAGGMGQLEGGGMTASILHHPRDKPASNWAENKCQNIQEHCGYSPTELFQVSSAGRGILTLYHRYLKKVWLHVFHDRNKHHLRFHALVRLHKQLSSTTSSCLALADRRYPVKELRILSNYPSMQAHHIIQLSVRFWMQHIQITCYRIQRRGGTERLRCGAPLQGPSPMSRWLHVNHNHLEWAEPYPTPAVVQKTQT